MSTLALLRVKLHRIQTAARVTAVQAPQVTRDWSTVVYDEAKHPRGANGRFVGGSGAHLEQEAKDLKAHIDSVRYHAKYLKEHLPGAEGRRFAEEHLAESHWGVHKGVPAMQARLATVEAARDRAARDLTAKDARDLLAILAHYEHFRNLPDNDPNHVLHDQWFHMSRTRDAIDAFVRRANRNAAKEHKAAGREGKPPKIAISQRAARQALTDVQRDAPDTWRAITAAVERHRANPAPPDVGPRMRELASADRTRDARQNAALRARRQEPPPVTPDHPTPRQEIAPRNAETPAIITSVFGAHMTLDRLQRLVAGPTGVVEVLGNPATHQVHVQFTDGPLRGSLTFAKKAGKITADVGLIHSDKPGSAAFELMRGLTRLRDVGVQRLTTHASGNHKSFSAGGERHGLTGYYNWAVLGFTAKLTPALRRAAQAHFNDPTITTIRDVIQRGPQGRAWWKANGKEFSGVLDFADPVAASVLDRYLTAQQRHATRAEIFHDDWLSPEDEELLGHIWDELGAQSQRATLPDLRLRLDAITRAANPNQAREGNGRFAPGSLSEHEAKQPSLNGEKIGGEGYRAHREASRLRTALASLKAKVDDLHQKGDHAAAEHVQANAAWRGKQGYHAILDHYATLQRTADREAGKLGGAAKTRAALTALAHEYRQRLQGAGMMETDRARLTEELRLIAEYGRRVGVRLDTPPAANGFPPLTKAERDSIRQQVAEALGQRRANLTDLRLRLAEVVRRSGQPVFGAHHQFAGWVGGPHMAPDTGGKTSGGRDHLAALQAEWQRHIARVADYQQLLDAAEAGRKAAEADVRQAWADRLAAQRAGDAAAERAAERAYQQAEGRNQQALDDRYRISGLLDEARYHAAVAGMRYEEARTGQPAYAIRHDAHSRETLRAIMGRDLTNAELGALTGAEPGSYLRVDTGRDGKVGILVYGPGHTWNEQRREINTVESPYTMQRILSRQDGVLTVRNQSFMVETWAQRRGIGTQAIARQVRTLIHLGGGRMTTYASRNDEPRMRYNGYMTWPRLGYDGPLQRQGNALVAQHGSEEVLIPLPAHLRDARTVQDILERDKAWWDANGYSIDLTFEAQRGSDSVRLLNRYLSEKGLPDV